MLYVLLLIYFCLSIDFGIASICIDEWIVRSLVVYKIRLFFFWNTKYLVLTIFVLLFCNSF